MSKLLNIGIVLLLIALLVRSEVVGAVAITLLAVALINRVWLRRLERGLRIQRVAPDVLAWGDEAVVRVRIANPTLWRVPWLELRESVPMALRLVAPPPTVISLPAGGEYELRYTIRGARRGWYRVGPLSLALGDVLGLQRVRLAVPAFAITVYPPVRSLGELGLPATLSYGPLRPVGVRQRLEDPARPAGVRQYMPGDALRRLDWKSSARQGTLLVRRADPTIAPETTIALAFGSNDYPLEVIQDALDRAATVAASIGVALLSRKLPVSLVTNGYDPLSEQTGVTLPFGKGDGQRRLLLHLLGRLGSSPDVDLLPLLHGHALPWGGTLLLVVRDLTLDLLPQLVAFQQRGQQLVLLLVEGSRSGLMLARQQHLVAYMVDRRGLPVRERSG
jgi:uncharacterized protein (DUF58 family)